jgi:hypothetical protein
MDHEIDTDVCVNDAVLARCDLRPTNVQICVKEVSTALSYALLTYHQHTLLVGPDFCIEY